MKIRHCDVSYISVVSASIISCFQYLDTIYEDAIIYSFINSICDKKIIYKIELYKHYDTR